MKSLITYPKTLKSELGLKLHKRRVQRELRREVKRLVQGAEAIKLIIGSGPNQDLVGAKGTNQEGWLITDVFTLDALDWTDWAAIFEPGQVSRIFAEHVIEHWTEGDFRKFLQITQRFVAPSGNIRIAVPDGFHPDPEYVAAVRPGGSGPGSDDHKVLYDYQRMTRILGEEGCEYDLLEYFDEQGAFHRKAWDAANGAVERSEHNDPRNQVRPLSYTSLIVDISPMMHRMPVNQQS